MVCCQLIHLFVSFVTNFNLAFGFLGGKEVVAAGVSNLGIYDRKYLGFLVRIILMDHHLCRELGFVVDSK